MQKRVIVAESVMLVAHSAILAYSTITAVVGLYSYSKDFGEWVEEKVNEKIAEKKKKRFSVVI